MRLVGYCTICHRIRRVTVSRAWLGTKSAPFGICADCEQKEREK